MDLLKLIQIVLRRWYLTVPILLASFGLGAYVQSVTPAEYDAAGSLILEEARFDPSRLATSVVNAGEIVARFEATDMPSRLGENDTQLVLQGRDSLTLEVRAAGSARAAVESSVEDAIEWISSEVETLQDDEEIREAERLRVAVLTPLISAEPLPNGNFEALGVVALRDPAAGVTNPYDAGGGTTSVLIAVVDTDAGEARVSSSLGEDVSFTLVSSRENQAIISVSALANDPAVAIAAYNEVREELDAELDRRQARASVPPSQRIIVADLSPPTEAVDVSPPLNRSVAAIILAGGLFAVGLAVLVDGISRRRTLAELETRSSSDTLQWWIGPEGSVKASHVGADGAAADEQIEAGRDEVS